MSDEPLNTSEMKYGRVTVGLEAVPLANSTKLYSNVVVFCDPSNSGRVWLGNREALQSNGPLGGIPIDGNLSLPISDPGQIYLIAEDVDQLVYWFGG
jgi:hypothetical protein